MITHGVEPSKIDMPRPRVTENRAHASAGLPVLGLSPLVLVAGLAVAIWGIVLVADDNTTLGVPLIVVGTLMFLGAPVAMAGLVAVAPGEARVIALFGRYVGTVRDTGLRWVNPLTTRKKVSTRIRNHETGIAKVTRGAVQRAVHPAGGQRRVAVPLTTRKLRGSPPTIR